MAAQRWALPAGWAQGPAPAAADRGSGPGTPSAPAVPLAHLSIHPDPQQPLLLAPPHAGPPTPGAAVAAWAEPAHKPPALSPPGPRTQHRWAPRTWNSPALPVNPGPEGPAGGGAQAEASLKTLPLLPRGAGALTASPPTSTGRAACSLERGGGEAKLTSSKLLHVALATDLTGKVEGDPPSVRPAVFGPGLCGQETTTN